MIRGRAVRMGVLRGFRSGRSVSDSLGDLLKALPSLGNMSEKREKLRKFAENTAIAGKNERNPETPCELAIKLGLEDSPQILGRPFKNT